MGKVLGAVKEVLKVAATLAYGGLISAMGLITLGGGLITILGGISSDKDEKPKTEE